jgi:hypothetical protein
LQDAERTAVKARRVLLGNDAVAAGLDAAHADRGIVEEGIEQADGIGAAADAGEEQIGQAPSFSRICARASSPMTRWKLRTITGYGCAP